MELSTVILLFTPFVVYLATEVAQKLIPKISGALTLLIAPALTVLLNLILGWAGLPQPMLIQIALGLGSVFVDQLLKQVKGE